MEHLDLETILSSSSSSSSRTSWMLPEFDQQDANFLSSSRQMLEPIMEETSEDEENQNWPQYENIWSSESETGSVIRIELHNDQDAISERDFVCPAKRPRRDDLIIIEGNPSYRKYSQQQRNDISTFNTPDTNNIENSNYRKRFDDFFSDSDSLSYNSLSRSSSLIQFESLEKQLQGDLNSSSLGYSSPSLLSIDANNSDGNKTLSNSLKRLECPSEGRIHQTYYDLDKIDFDNTLIFNDSHHHHHHHHQYTTTTNKSDSESSDNSILSHEERIIKPSSSSLFIGNHSNLHRPYKIKSSTENLSEDSGYCEYVSALKTKSKSIPNFLHEKFLEQDKIENHKSLEIISTKRQRYKCNENYNEGVGDDGGGDGSVDDEILLLSRNYMNNDIIFRNKINKEKQLEPQYKYKINEMKPLMNIKNEMNNEQKHQHQHYHMKQNHDDDDDYNGSDGFMYWFNAEDQSKNKIHTNRQNNNECSSSPIVLGSLPYTPSSSSSASSSVSPSSFRKIESSKLYNSSSLPDVRIQSDHIFNVNNLSDPKSYDNNNYCDRYNSDSCDLYNLEKNTHNSSLPNDLNIILSYSVLNYNTNNNNNNNNRNNNNQQNNNRNNVNDCEFEWRNLRSNSVRSENRLYTTSSNFGACYSPFNQSYKTIASSGQNYINASYNNLTLLDYSGRSKSNRNSFNMSENSGNSKRNSREFELGKGNFLLDELSKHFDRDLSIISDRGHDSDLVSEFLENEKIINTEQNELETKPKPPARRSHSQREQTKNNTKKPIIEKPPRKHCTSLKTFDQDPTILKTNYTESLEKCNFDPKELSNNALTEISSHSTPIKRNFVASTPNLSAFQHRKDEIDDDLHISSAHTSMNPLPCEKKMGILLSEGSRTSLGKGVSFCPVVSEIRWREQSSEEQIDPDSLENVHHEKINQDMNELNNLNNNNKQFISGGDEVDANIITTDTSNTSQVTVNANNIQNKNLLTTKTEFNYQQKPECELKLNLKTDDDLLKSNGSAVEETMNIEKKISTISSVSIVTEGTTSNSNSLGKEVKNKCSEENTREIYTNNNNNDNKMLNCVNTNKNDNQKRSDKVIKSNKNVNNNNVGIKSATMPLSLSEKETVGSGNNNIKVNTNTGNDLLSSKFKPKPDEKHHKNGFLSRFTGGFRFSLRRKKKPSLSTSNDLNTNDKNTVVLNNKQSNKKSIADGAKKSSNNSNSFSSKDSPDFIYIPLKGPLHQRQSQQYFELQSNDEKDLDNSHLSSCSKNISYGNDNNHVLLGKPPLPKQPPRVVGVCEKIRAGPQQQNEMFSCSSFGAGNGNYRHAPGQRSSSQPKEIDENFLDSERQYYATDGDYQLNRAMNQNGCSSPLSGTTVLKTLPPLPPTKCPVARPVGISIGSTVGPNGNAKIGLIETNLDTHETIISGKTRSLMELGPQVRHTLSKQSAGSGASDTVIIDGVSKRPHKSMEFLLDKENQKNAMPPENELQKSHDSTTALSEHQLRVQASLQRLNIPDWFRQYNSTPKSTNDSSYKPGNFTRKRASDSGRWTGLNSKTTSLSSLGSQRSDRSPLLLSPSAHSHHGGQIGFSRWSTSHLNSTQTSPSVSTRGSFSRGTGINSSFISGHSIVSGSSIRNSFRQPYLGWRSQEKLTSPRTPHERLASTLLAQKPPKPEPAVTPEIQTSIKEVTSAIVHYVNDQTNRTARSRSASPNSRKCWLESSFVGTRPAELPQTPIIDNSFSTSGNANQTSTLSSSIHSGTSQQSDVLHVNGVATPIPSLTIATERSPSSASLEDVLASLLGLPTDSHRSTGDSANEIMFHYTSTSPSNLQVDPQNRFRRRSEGDAQKQQKVESQHHHNQQQQQQHNQSQINESNNEILLPNNNQSSRRVSLDSSESKTTSELLIKCRNTKCDQASTTADAKKYYKSCHNCSHLYCSRECRRTHWEKHRKACLHSRVSNLCRQVLSSCKDDMDTLRHLSLLARNGYISQGRGVVRILFRSPENAEAFIKNGFQCLGEASYVRWPDLMPAEMGLELYSELLRLSTEYKPDSKMLIYVAICVVSEAPGTATAPVKWERQLVSRCAKLKICKSVLSELSDQLQQTTPIQESQTEILILTFNQQKKSNSSQREIISTNIQTILNRRGVILRRHYPEIYQRLQNFVEGQNDRFMPVTIHPRDSQTGQGFVCIIMPTYAENELIRLPNSDSGNRVSIIDVGEEFLES